MKIKRKFVAVWQTVNRFFRFFSQIQTKIILTVIYFLIIVPLGVMIRLAKLFLSKNRKTYWISLAQDNKDFFESFYHQY